VTTTKRRRSWAAEFEAAKRAQNPERVRCSAARKVKGGQCSLVADRYYPGFGWLCHGHACGRRVLYRMAAADIRALQRYRNEFSFFVDLAERREAGDPEAVLKTMWEIS
jgi:hypothetical protein